MSTLKTTKIYMGVMGMFTYMTLIFLAVDKLIAFGAFFAMLAYTLEVAQND